MKKAFPFLLLLATFILCSCGEEMSPEGPSDIRIYNQTASDFENIVVDIDGEKHSYGNLASGEYTEYFRFPKAYPKAFITLTIGDQSYSTAEPDYTYAVYLGQGKFAYKVFILDEDASLLDNTVVAEAPLDD